MTFIPEKKDAIYVRGVVIACEMQDTQGDTAPNKEGIKRIFTNYLKQESDVEHSYISNFNVHQLENTITQTPIKINGQDVPIGSWIASHMVLNPKLIAMIRDKKLNGYSLGAIGDAGLNENITIENNFLNKSGLLQYKDLKSYEELNPFFISFVNNPSNQFTWEVMDYNQFLSKSNNKVEIDITGDMMTENIEQNDEMVKVSVVERLLGPLLNKASEEQKEEVETGAKDEEKEEEVETEISNNEIMAKLEELEKNQLEPSVIAGAVVDAMKQLATETVQQKQEAEALAKSSNEEQKGEEEVDATKLEKSANEEPAKNEEPKMEKSSNKLDEMSTIKKVEPRNRFLGGERRDEYGRVRKYV